MGGDWLISLSPDTEEVPQKGYMEKTRGTLREPAALHIQHEKYDIEQIAMRLSMRPFALHRQACETAQCLNAPAKKSKRNPPQNPVR
jgi:hypothetical protein